MLIEKYTGDSLTYLNPFYCSNVLRPEIEKVMKELGINELTLPQIKAIPEILKGEDCLVIAPTGMGKTESALIPVFNLFMKNRREGINILYITPLRALNRDMLRRTFYWGKALGIKIAVRHGDTSIKERKKQVLHPPNMLITTPETLQIMLTGKKLRQLLKNVRWVVIDEIHELAEDERGAQLSVALERVREISGDFQRIGLSATVGNPQEIAKFLNAGRKVKIIYAMGKKKMKIEMDVPEIKEVDREIAMKTGLDIKSSALIRRIKEIIEKHNATLFFVNTRDTAEILASRLREMGASIEVHHGSLSKEARIEAEEKFKEGSIRALICTSSLELGIDIGHADFVLQYNSPRQVTRIIQRVGRSGHKIGEVSNGKIVSINPEEYAEAYVIAKKAVKNEIEKTRIRENPLSVLANQIISMAVEHGNIEAEKIYEIIRRAYPFRNLNSKKFYEVIEQLKKSGVIWFENGIVKRRKKSIFYFIDNISMIPDEKSYEVIDISSNKKIGKLDERFVSSYCDIGYRFIMKGRAWEVVERKECILVSPVDKTYTVPDWAGEEIPVPFEIAREVGKLRRMVCEGKIKDKIIEEEIKEQVENGFKVPCDSLITVEYEGNNVYVYTHFGTKVNETLGKIVGSLLSQRVDEGIVTGSDAYRIFFKIPRSFDLKIIEDILKSIEPQTVEHLLRIILKNSSSIKWEVVKVARKFGIIERGADYEKISVNRIINILSNTPFMEEVIDKAIWDRMDVENTVKALEMIRMGEIKFHFQKLSPITMEGEKVKQEFFKPFGIDASTLEALRKRIEDTRIKMICMNCKYSIVTRVYRAPTKCPKCSSKMLAVVKGKENERRMMKSASLVAYYGKKAIFVMAGHGIGPDTASRIISMQKEGNELLKEILEKEIVYARTKRFWHD
ncbi:MAG TPA: DEAD/DEAH box helicase [Thermoplasmatales archaeon]|nr:DEAD/DEAH box helicase [Thermoplasmatales archaeon]